MKTLVVIPYCSAGAQGRELEYAVAGWRRHFKEDHLIVLAGEDHPVTRTGDDICCVQSTRVDPIEGQYRQHLDYVSCLKKVRKAFPDTPGFIFVADDCYAVNDFDLVDVKVLKKIEDTINFSRTSSNAWQRDAAKTRDQLAKDGFPTRNFTTHLPQWYDWDKIEELWSRYDMEHQSYLMEDLYYNIYYKDRLAVNVHAVDQPYKFGVYNSKVKTQDIKNAMKNHIWITNSPVGWSSDLDNLLLCYLRP